MTLTQVTHNTKTNYTNSKAIHNLISSLKFIEAYESASKENQERVLTYIENKNKINILKWLYKESGHVPVYKLRQLCQRHGIKNYNRLTPNRLLNQLKRILTEEQILIYLYD